MASVTSAKDLFDLSGEVALVTGASSGLGARFAEVLACHGAKVVLAARRKDRIEALAARLPRATAIALDVTETLSVASAFDTAEQAFGPVTLLVNNAGVASGGRFIDATPEEWRRVQATNVDAVWNIAQIFARRLIAAKTPGSIINIASVAGYRVNGVSTAYAVSKAAVVQLTNSLALELARHAIRVNAIAPGYITSEMTAAYLESDQRRFFVPCRHCAEPFVITWASMVVRF